MMHSYFTQVRELAFCTVPSLSSLGPTGSMLGLMFSSTMYEWVGGQAVLIHKNSVEAFALSQNP